MKENLEITIEGEFDSKKIEHYSNAASEFFGIIIQGHPTFIVIEFKEKSCLDDFIKAFKLPSV